jgi:hypothetical protein
MMQAREQGWRLSRRSLIIFHNKEKVYPVSIFAILFAGRGL